MNNKNYFKRWEKIINKALNKYLPKETEVPQVLHQAIRYSVFSGGKRIRPILTLEAASLFGDWKKIIPSACAIEMIHTYSLIHDDLPCMDNDELRRGKPTTWKKFGEAVSILAGCALLSRSFEILTTEQTKILKNSKDNVIKLLQEISEAIGSYGLIGGQTLDIITPFEKMTTETLKYIHLNKTAKLFTISVRAGAILFGVKEKYLNILTKFGIALGEAFQIADDIMDFEVEEKKCNYAKIVGLSRAKQHLEEKIHQAKTQLAIFKEKGKNLKSIADFIGENTKSDKRDTTK